MREQNCKSIRIVLIIALIVFCRDQLYAAPASLPIGKEVRARQEAIAQLLRQVRDRGLGPGRASQQAEAPRINVDRGGYITHLAAPPGHYFPVTRVVQGNPSDTALNFINEHRQLLGAEPLSMNFRSMKSRRQAGRNYERFRQTYMDIPVFAGEIIVQLDDEGGVRYLSSDISKDLPAVDGITVPSITPDEARIIATGSIGDEIEPEDMQFTEPVLNIFDPAVLGVEGSPRLVWRFRVTSSDVQFRNSELLIDARNGEVVRNYTLEPPALFRLVSDAANTSSGTLVRQEGDPPSAVAEANAAYDFLGDTYNFYLTFHGRDGGRGCPLLGDCQAAVVRLCEGGVPCPWDNATGGALMKFGEGYAVDDIVGHEYTHGVTFWESGLVYENAPGAINESFSDIWGEFVDLTNGAGNDAATARWTIGEDLPHYREGEAGNPIPGDGNPEQGLDCANGIDDDGDGYVDEGCPVGDWVYETGAACGNLLDDDGDTFIDEGCPGNCIDGIDNDNDGLVDATDNECSLRKMSDPPWNAQPDRLGSPFYFQPVPNPDDTNDQGGVHTNSGIINKLAYLLTDGGTFNGYTVSSTGLARVIDVLYEVQTNLLVSGAYYYDFYGAIVQAAINRGWSITERNNLARACLAVEISYQEFSFDTYVSASSGDDFYDGSISRPVETVVRGNALVRPGHNLRIESGSYNESVIFEKFMGVEVWDPTQGSVIIGE